MLIKPDGRQPLAENVQLKSGAFTIRQCIGFGCSSLIYEAENAKGASVIIKEVFPVAYGKRDAFIRKDGIVCPNGEFEPETKYGRKAVTVAELTEYFIRTKNKAIQEEAIVNEIERSNKYDKNFPYLNKIEDSFEENGTYYFAVRNSCLSPFPPKLELVDALKYTLRILQPLKMLHHCGYLHLDVKPENIMVASFGTGKNQAPILYPIDFNSCNKIGAELTSDKISRTITYAAPELKRVSESNFNSDEIGKHTDIYSVGIILLKLLTAEYCGEAEFNDFVCGKSVLVGDNAGKATKLTDGALRRGILGQFPVLAKKIADGLDISLLEKLNTILEKSLFKNIQFRYADCEEMMADIDDVLDMIEHPETIIPAYFERHYTSIAQSLPEDDFGVILENNISLAQVIKNLPNGKNLLVTGEGGSGKSTLLRRFGSSLSKTSDGKEQHSAVYVPLIKVETSIEEYIDTSVFAGFGLDWKNYYHDNTVIFLLDGYNEVSPRMRELLSGQIEALRTTFPKGKVVLATRKNPGFFLDFDECKISPLREDQVIRMLSARGISIESNKHLLPILTNAGLLMMFLKSSKRRFIEDDNEKRLTEELRILCEWKDLKEPAAVIELLWNFSFYDFLEKSQTKTREERAILFMCIRFFIPAIAFDMAKRNAAHMFHGDINYVQICTNTLNWVRTHTEMPLLEKLNGFVHGQIKDILENLDIADVLRLIKEELLTLNAGLHQLNRDFLAAMHLRNLLFIDSVKKDIELLSVLADSFNAETDWEDTNELQMLKHILRYDVEAKCEIPKSIISPQHDEDNEDARISLEDIAEQLRMSLNAYATDLRQSLSAVGKNTEQPISQIKAQLEYFYSKYSYQCGEAFLWWLHGINEAENDISFEAKKRKRKDDKFRREFSDRKYRNIHFNVCWDSFTGKELNKIPFILSSLVAGEFAWSDVNSKLYAAVCRIYIAKEKRINVALKDAKTTYKTIITENDKDEGYLTEIGIAQFISGKERDDEENLSIIEVLLKDKVKPKQIKKPKKRKLSYKVQAVTLSILAVLFLSMLPFFINGIGTILRFIGFDGISVRPASIGSVAAAVSNDPLKWLNWLALIGCPILFAVFAGLLALIIYLWRTDEDEETTGVYKWGSIIASGLCLLCVAGFVFGGMIPKGNVKYNEVKVYGISIQKESSDKALSETDLQNAELAVYENLDGLRNKEKEPVSLVSLLYGRFAEKVIFVVLLILAFFAIRKMLRTNKVRRKYVEKLKKSNEKLSFEIYFAIIREASVFALIAFSLLVWVKPNISSITANAISRPVIGRPMTNVLQTGSQNLFRLRDDMLTTGYYQMKNGSRYEGEFIGNSITGKGIYTMADGTVKEGTFVFGRMYGNGTVTDANKNQFVGEFRGDMLCGLIRITDADGSVLFEGEIIDKPATMETISKLLVKEEITP